MAKLKWDASGERFFEMGIRKGVLYPVTDEGTYGAGVAWNGLTSVDETPDGAEANDMYADDMKYASLRSAETFGGTINAYMFPDEFYECDGSATLAAGVYIGQQTRRKFGLCYQTQIGNDVQSEGLAYKLHLVYGCTASPSERSYEAINDSPEPIEMSWEFDTTPAEVDGYKNTSLITIDSRKVNKAKLEALEKILYGDTETDPKLPSPAEVIAMFKD